jgi:hypothetical protein
MVENGNWMYPKYKYLVENRWDDHKSRQERYHQGHLHDGVEKLWDV